MANVINELPVNPFAASKPVPAVVMVVVCACRFGRKPRKAANKNRKGKKRFREEPFFALDPLVGDLRIGCKFLFILKMFSLKDYGYYYWP